VDGGWKDRIELMAAKKHRASFPGTFSSLVHLMAGKGESGSRKRNGGCVRDGVFWLRLPAIDNP
jgi:hypothetical protein